MPQRIRRLFSLPLHPSPNCAAAAAISAGMTLGRIRQLLHPNGRIIRLRPGVMPLALPHPTPRPPRRARHRWGCSRASGSATDKPPRLSCGLWPCTVMADAMRPLGMPSSSPKPTMTAGRSWLSLHGYPSSTVMADAEPFRERQMKCVYGLIMINTLPCFQHGKPDQFHFYRYVRYSEWS